MTSSIEGGNAAPTGGGVLTVSGVNFRTTDATASMAIQTLLCSTASWSSRTSVLCTPTSDTQNSGGAKMVALSASGVVGTRTGLFTFDGKQGVPKESLFWT